MAKLNPETIISNAIRSFTLPAGCISHGDECVRTIYTTAEQSMGGKAHTYEYDFHSAAPDEIRGGSLPYCGSRNNSRSSHGQFVPAKTCGRC